MPHSQKILMVWKHPLRSMIPCSGKYFSVLHFLCNSTLNLVDIKYYWIQTNISTDKRISVHRAWFSYVPPPMAACNAPPSYAWGSLSFKNGGRGLGGRWLIFQCSLIFGLYHESKDPSRGHFLCSPSRLCNSWSYFFHGENTQRKSACFGTVTSYLNAEEGDINHTIPWKMYEEAWAKIWWVVILTHACPVINICALDIVILLRDLHERTAWTIRRLWGTNFWVI